jgi:hypothetical protein
MESQGSPINPSLTGDQLCVGGAAAVVQAMPKQWVVLIDFDGLCEAGNRPSQPGSFLATRLPCLALYFVRHWEILWLGIRE